MNDDAVARLEQLAALHSKGDLTDGEFAEAKASVLNAQDPGDADADAGTGADATGAGGFRVAVTAGSETISPPRSRPRPAGRATSGIAKRVRHDHEKGLWRQWWVLIVAAFCGFMYATAVTAVVPGSGLWTGRFLCDSGFRMASDTRSYSYGNTSGQSITFACVQGHVAKGGLTAAVMGLQ